MTAPIADDGSMGADDADATPAWLAAEDPAPSPTRRRALWIAAAAPWLVVGLLVARAPSPSLAGPSPDAQPATPTTAPPAAAPSEPDLDPTATRPRAPGEPSDTPFATLTTSQARSRVTLADAAAVALLVARDVLGSGPTLGQASSSEPPSEATYVDLVTPESIDFPQPGHVVVTVLAIVLHADGGAYDRAELVRLAIPIRLDHRGARPAGTPWRLPTPDLAPDEPAFAPVEDPDLLLDAATALQDAGFDGAEVVGLERSDGWPWRVTATHGGRSIAVWLRIDQRRFVVAGSPPRQEPTGPTTRSTSEANADDAARP